MQIFTAFFAQIYQGGLTVYMCPCNEGQRGSVMAPKKQKKHKFLT